MPQYTEFRVWHIPQVPGKAFHVPVKDAEEGALVLRALADYDLFQHEHNIKPDYANAQGLEAREAEGEWGEWESVDGAPIEDVADMMLAPRQKRTPKKKCTP